MAQQVKNLSTMQETQETQVWSLCQKNLLQKEMVIHFSILAWETSQTEEPMGSPWGCRKVRNNL